MVALLVSLMIVCAVVMPYGVIDVGTDPLLSLTQLARRLPRRRNDRPVAPSTVHRWRYPGIRGVRLECIRVGGAWCTTLRAVQEFCDRLTGAQESGPADAPGNSTTGKDDRHQARIETELDRELGAAHVPHADPDRRGGGVVAEQLINSTTTLHRLDKKCELS